MVRIAVRSITFNCLKGVVHHSSSSLVRTHDVENYMNLPSSQKYFRELVYFVISMIVTLNQLIEESYVFSVDIILVTSTRQVN